MAKELAKAIFIEGYYFMNWAKKTKNYKTKRKLLIKAKREIDRIHEEKETARERARRFIYGKSR